MNIDLFMWLCCVMIQVWLFGLWEIFREGMIHCFWFLVNQISQEWCFFFQQPSEQNTYSDIEAVYRCLEEKYGVKEQDVILYGQSVGSGPTLELASRLPNLRAVVLHSAIASGLRVMYPVKRTYWFDIYKVLVQTFLFSTFPTLLMC